MFNRIGLTAICALLVLLFAALPMALMAGRAVKAHGKHAATKSEAPRQNSTQRQ